jgi:hypothetical protein
MQSTDVRRRGWDFSLTIITVVLLASLGLQSFIGTLYVWWAQTTIPNWEQTSYDAYVTLMNLLAAPQLVALVVVMGLCVPKRLFTRRTLVMVSAAMVAAGAFAGFASGSLATGVTVYLGFAALIQLAVVLLTAAGASGPSYLTEGRLTKLGSGLLHLGFIVFGIVVAALQRSAFVLPVFWVATVLITLGTIMSFYANRLAVRHVEPVEQPIAL